MIEKLILEIDTEDAEALAATDSTDDYKFITIEFLGEWRWGNEYQVVFQDVHDNFWGFTYRESVGDEYYTSIGEYGNIMKCKEMRAVEVTTIKYEVA